MWHSLCGLAREPEAALDFSRCYPALVRDAWQPQCTGITVRVKGIGRLTLELKSPEGEILWQASRRVRRAGYHDVSFPLTAQQMRRLRRVKTLTWVAGPGSALSIDSVGLAIRYPDIPLDKKLFLISYAKLARCYSPANGVVKDRAHFPAGEFDCVPTSGLFCLATALAWKLDIVDRDTASDTLKKVHAAISAVPRAKGLLPHFIRKYDGRHRICDGTEYSTVDTSLYYHGMLLAARILDDVEMEGRLAREVQSIAMGDLHTSEGHVTHGVKDDGATLLPSYWRDWGGETALVLLLERMALRDAARLRMDDSGRVHQGTGFILEIQNLFYREFDSETTDAVTRQNWHARRRELLARQMAYRSGGDDQCVKETGVFGRSAGEGPRGVGYVAHGVDAPGVTLIHPHYMLMSATAQQDPKALYRVFQKMEQKGLLPPWGMVENVDGRSGEYLPLSSSLNASFEAIAAYHLWAKTNHEKDAVYDAADRCETLSQAIRAFYPSKQQ
jgi:hypothetical protein